MLGFIFDIKRFAVHDGPGIRATVFFKGCALNCMWCHNPESIKRNPQKVNKTVMLNGREYTKTETIGYEITVNSLFDELLKEQVFMAESGGGVTFSGGEPLMQHEFLYEMLKMCKAHGIHTAVDTTLYASWEKISRLATVTDLFLVDLKVMDNGLHKQYTGVENKTVLENLVKLSASGAAIVIRIPVIPAVSDTPENIKETINFLKTLPEPVNGINLLPFHNTANEKYKRVAKDNPFGHLKSMKKEELVNIKNEFENAGFYVKIGG